MKITYLIIVNIITYLLILNSTYCQQSIFENDTVFFSKINTDYVAMKNPKIGCHYIPLNGHVTCDTIDINKLIKLMNYDTVFWCLNEGDREDVSEFKYLFENIGGKYYKKKIKDIQYYSFVKPKFKIIKRKNKLYYLHFNETDEYSRKYGMKNSFDLQALLKKNKPKRIYNTPFLLYESVVESHSNRNSKNKNDSAIMEYIGDTQYIYKGNKIDCYNFLFNNFKFTPRGYVNRPFNRKKFLIFNINNYKYSILVEKKSLLPIYIHCLQYIDPNELMTSTYNINEFSPIEKEELIKENKNKQRELWNEYTIFSR